MCVNKSSLKVILRMKVKKGEFPWAEFSLIPKLSRTSFSKCGAGSTPKGFEEAESGRCLEGTNLQENGLADKDNGNIVRYAHGSRSASVM